MLGTNVRVRAGTDLERVVVHDNAYLGEGVRLRGTTVGRSCDLRNGVRGEEGVVLGDECFVGEHAVLAAGVKIYPFKTVETGAVINSSIVWESRGSRSLFGRVGVAGLANVDVTPELAARVAMAYATTLKKDSTVIISRDSSRSARMLKRAMMAGLNASGVNVLDLEVSSVPVTRFATSRPEIAGGITLRLLAGDPQSCVIRFFDTKGRGPHRGRPAQDRAAVPAGGLPPGLPGRDRRHRLPAPGPRAVHGGAGGHRRRQADPGRQVQDRGRLRLRLQRLRRCPTCWPSWGPTSWA